MYIGKERVRAQASMREGNVTWRKTILDHEPSNVKAIRVLRGLVIQTT